MTSTPKTPPELINEAIRILETAMYGFQPLGFTDTDYADMYRGAMDDAVETLKEAIK